MKTEVYYFWIIPLLISTTMVEQNGCDNYRKNEVRFYNDNQPPPSADRQCLEQRKLRIQQGLASLCLWCFAYSTRKTLDCLRRPLVGRVQFLHKHMCLFNASGYVNVVG